MPTSKRQVDQLISALSTTVNKLQSTGVISGTGAVINGVDSSKFNLQVIGQVVDPVTFTVYSVSVNTTLQTVVNLATQNSTFIGINQAGLIIQQATPFTTTQKYSLIGEWELVHYGNAEIESINSYPNYCRNLAEQLHSFMNSIAGFNVTGNVFSANGANVKLDKSAGIVQKLGIGNQTVTSANEKTLASGTQVSFTIINQSGTETGSVTDVDTTNYDLNGVTTALPGGATDDYWQTYRIYMYGDAAIKLLRGQYVYTSMKEAQASINTESYVIEPGIEANGILRGYLIVRKGTTDFSDDTKALFIEADKFGLGPVYGIVPTLQTSYDVSSSAIMQVNDLRGAFAIRNNRSSNSSNIQEWKNLAGTTTAFIKGDGSFSALPAPTRVNLEIDKITSIGDANYNILITDKTVSLNAALTTPRTWTLPLANAVNSGFELIITDEAGGIDNINTLTVDVSGSDTINGATTSVFDIPYSTKRFISNGVDKWTATFVATGTVLTLSNILNNGNTTGGQDITSDDGLSILSLLDTDQIYLYNTNGGFYITDTSVIQPNRFQIKTTVTDISHSTLLNLVAPSITLDGNVTVTASNFIKGGTGWIDFYNQTGVALTSDSGNYTTPYVWADSTTGFAARPFAGLFEDGANGKVIQLVAGASTDVITVLGFRGIRVFDDKMILSHPDLVEINSTTQISIESAYTEVNSDAVGIYANVGDLDMWSNANAQLYNNDGGFYVSNNNLFNVNRFQVSLSENLIKHQFQNTVIAPINNISGELNVVSPDTLAQINLEDGYIGLDNQHITGRIYMGTNNKGISISDDTIFFGSKLEIYSDDVINYMSPLHSFQGGDIEIESWPGRKIYQISGGGSEIGLAFVDGTDMQLQWTDGVDVTALTMNNTDSINVSSTRVGFEGLKYSADYSANFVARSLVDKAYADSLVGAYLPLAGGTMVGNVTMSDGTSIGYSAIDGTNLVNFSTSQMSFQNTDAVTGYSTLVTFEGTGTTNVISVLSTDPAFVGIEYQGDYSANFVNESLVSKRYVDSADATKLPIEAGATTGTVLTFVTDSVYGSIATPETGNISYSTTGAKVGVTNVIIHNHSVAPTFAANMKKLSGSGNYVLSVVNYIYVTYINATEVIYIINQRT